MMRLLIGFYFCLCPLIHADTSPLRLHLADNHAESFRWFANQFDLDARYHMVLIDHHSDASCVERSDDIREQLRRVNSVEQRQQRCWQWRDQGRIQAYNWIEPLMPRPIERVTWIPALSLDAKAAAECRSKAQDEIDSRMEFELRSSGALARAWNVEDFTTWKKSAPQRVPTVFAVDLDFFLGVPREQWAQTWHDLWWRMLKEPHLKSISCCISRPWQQSDDDVNALLRMVLWSYSRTFPATVSIDLEMDRCPDDSLEAEKWRQQGKEIPRWNAEHLPIDLRDLMARHQHAWHFEDRKREWKKILHEWGEGLPPIRMHTPVTDADGVIRIRTGAENLYFSLPDDASDEAIRWYAVEPMHHAVDLLSETMLGKSFSDKPASFVSDSLRFLEETPDAALALAKHCPSVGRYRFLAEIPLKQGGFRRTMIADVRRMEGEGFKAALCELFRQPYVFGIGVMKNGVENAWGSDCSNMLVYAWRRNGVPMKWGDPSTVVSQLQRHEPNQEMSAEVMNTGVAISFGKHMAALWEDRPPLRFIGPEDLVMHHLGNVPEIVPLSRLMENRPSYQVYCLPDEPTVDIGFIGDVVMKQSTPHDRERLCQALDGMDAAFGNLEGLPAAKQGMTDLDLRFAASAMPHLRTLAQRITAFSVANNHAGDGGADLDESLKTLLKAKIPTFGTDVAPFHWEKNGVRLTLFAVSVVQTKGEVLTWEKHADALMDAIARERATGRHVIVMTHWGKEYQTTPDEEQRNVATKLQRAGAIAVIGAHPHVDQKIEWHNGGVIAYSLGNALYPSKWQAQDSGSVLTLRIHQGGRISLLKREPL